MSGDVFWLSQLGGLVLASTGQRPGVLLNILQCTGQPPTEKNCLIPSVGRVAVKKSWNKSIVHANQWCHLEVLPLFWCSGITVSLFLSHLKKCCVLQNDEFFRTFCLSYLCSVPSRVCASLCWGANGVMLLWVSTLIRQTFVLQTPWRL